MRYLIFLIAVLQVGCTTVNFRSRGEIPVSFQINPKHTKPVRIEGVSKFYLGGSIPRNHAVYIDEVVKNAGYSEISGLAIYEGRSFSNMMIKFLTLGIYIPTAYTVTGYTSEKEQH